jgi:hypothetical protein
MTDGKTTHPPFTPAMVETYVDMVEAKLNGKEHTEDDILAAYRATTSYQVRTALYRSLIEKLEERGHTITESEL